MKFLKDAIRAWQHRRTNAVTPEEFLKAIQDDFGRELDPESVFFFRHHIITVNLVHRILSGRLKQSGDDKKDGLVIQALVGEMTEYTPSASNLPLRSPTIIADCVEEFSKSYKDAGNIIGQALAVFLKLK